MHAIFRGVLVSTMMLSAMGAACAQTLPQTGTVLEQSSEYRFQLDLHVNDAALAKMLPAGWISAAATAGAAKDANLRLIFVDGVNIVGPDNKLLGKGANRLVMMAAPVKKADGAAAGQMILGGISEDIHVPDGFGVYRAASRADMTRTSSTANGVTVERDDWDFAAAGGEHVSLHLKFTPAPANKAEGETRFYNPADPSQYLLFKTQQATDITRNATTSPPDRVLEFSLKAGGGDFAALLDGSEKPLSWDSQPIYVRTVSAP